MTPLWDSVAILLALLLHMKLEHPTGVQNTLLRSGTFCGSHFY